MCGQDRVQISSRRVLTRKGNLPCVAGFYPCAWKKIVWGRMCRFGIWASNLVNRALKCLRAFFVRVHEDFIFGTNYKLVSKLLYGIVRSFPHATSILYFSFLSNWIRIIFNNCFMVQINWWKLAIWCPNFEFLPFLSIFHLFLSISPLCIEFYLTNDINT